MEENEQNNVAQNEPIAETAQLTEQPSEAPDDSVPDFEALSRGDLLTLQAEFPELEGLTSHGTTLTSHGTTLTSHGTRLSAAEGTLSSLADSIADILSELSDLDDRVTALEEGGGGGSAPFVGNLLIDCQEVSERFPSDPSVFDGGNPDSINEAQAFRMEGGTPLTRFNS